MLGDLHTLVEQMMIWLLETVRDVHDHANAFAHNTSQEGKLLYFFQIFILQFQWWWSIRKPAALSWSSSCWYSIPVVWQLARGLMFSALIGF